MNHWQPLFDGFEQERILSTARQVLDVASTVPRSPFDWGLPLLLNYSALVTGADDLNAAADDLLDCAIEQVGAVRHCGLYGGLAGVTWLVAHLRPTTETRCPDTFSDVDEAFDSLLGPSSWGDNYDLIAGLVGYAVSFCERRLTTPGIVRLNRVVSHLIDLQTTMSDDGIAWHTRQELLPPTQVGQVSDGYYNLGVAHGAPGALWVLAKGVSVEGAADARVSIVLEHGVRWLLSHRKAGGLFPVWLDGRTMVAPKPTGLSWCYGGLGVSSVLFGIAEMATREDWRESALSIARSLSEVSTDTSDSGLCHGIAGIAHLFNRLYQASGDARLGDAARRWFRRLIDLRYTRPGLAGFWSASSPAESGDATFLTGVTGVGLALLGAATSIEPEWDRVLLTDV